MTQGFSGDIIEMTDMDGLVQLMTQLGISAELQMFLKPVLAEWKKNPESAFQALDALEAERHIQGQGGIHEAAKAGDLTLVQAYVTVDASCVNLIDKTEVRARPSFVFYNA